MKPDGLDCGVNAECESGHCVIDLCCHTTCPAQAPSSCGNDGNCAEGGASCEPYGAGTGCGTPACDGGMLTKSACDGAGTCGDGTTAPCPGHFACSSPSACATSCEADSGCGAGYYCVTPGGTCAAVLAAGKPCTAGDQCQSGQCSAGTHVCL